MSVRFLDKKQVERFRQALNNDPEFKLAARYVTTDVLLEVGDSQCIVKFRDGVVAEINLEPNFMDTWQFAIKGPADAWEKFLKPVPPPFYTSLFATIIRATMQVIGDLEAAFAYFWAMNRMLNFMRDFQNS